LLDQQLRQLERNFLNRAALPKSYIAQGSEQEADPEKLPGGLANLATILY